MLTWAASVIHYNGPGPLSALSESQTDHRLTVLHAAIIGLRQ